MSEMIGCFLFLVTLVFLIVLVASMYVGAGAAAGAGLAMLFGEPMFVVQTFAQIGATVGFVGFIAHIAYNLSR